MIWTSTKLISNYKIISISVTFFLILLNQTNQKDIYHSIDGSQWISSQYVNEAYFNKSKYYQSEQTNFQNLSFPSRNFTLEVESLPPYQYISFKILQEDSIGSLNYLTNITMNEFSSESNIYYDKNKSLFLSDNFNFSYLKNSSMKDATYASADMYVYSSKKSFLADNKKNYTKKLDEFFSLTKSANNNNSRTVECFVDYSGLSYEQTSEQISGKNALYSSVVNFFSINFVTYKNTAGVFIEKFLNGKLANKTELGNFITNNISISAADFSSLKFAKIFPSFLYQKHYLFLVDEQNSNVYLLRIKSNEQSLKEFNSQIIGLTIDALFTFKNDQKEKIYFNSETLLAASQIQEQQSSESSLYFVTTTALFKVFYMDNKVTNIISVDSFQDPDTLEKIKFDVIDAKFDKDGCYVALRNYGLVGFNTKEAKMSLIYRHRKIHRIDSFFFEDRNIGVFLNNVNYTTSHDTPDTREFLIELNKPNYIFKGNYTVNKVFFSGSSSIKDADYYSKGVLDTSASRSFILEKQSNKVFLIARNLPYQINNIDTFFVLPEELQNKAYNYFNLVSVFKDKKSRKTSGAGAAAETLLQGVLLLQTTTNKDQKQYSFFRFQFNLGGKFVCEINQIGTYLFQHQFYSYYDKQFVRYALEKKIRLYSHDDADDVVSHYDMSLAVILILIIVSVVFFGLYFALKKCREHRITESYSSINS